MMNGRTKALQNKRDNTTVIKDDVGNILRWQTVIVEDTLHESDFTHLKKNKCYNHRLIFSWQMVK